jgi:hypothetical protein
MNAMTDKPIRAIKGFDRDLKCRGFQFEVGTTYTHDGPVVACKSGFHAIEGNPLEVFEYYPPGDGSRFCEVDASGEIARHTDDSKLAAGVLHVAREMTVAEVVAAAVKWASDKGKVTDHATGDQSAASATGNLSAASATGDRSAASATGNLSAASATGNLSAASATGYRSAASATGYRSAASAMHSTACALAAGFKDTASGVDGAALFAVERRDDGTILSVACGIVGRNGIRKGVSYRCAGGRLVEAVG